MNRYRVTIQFELTKTGYKEATVLADSPEHAQHLVEVAPDAYPWGPEWYAGEAYCTNERVMFVESELPAESC